MPPVPSIRTICSRRGRPRSCQDSDRGETKRTMPTHAWTPLKTNIQIDMKETYAEVKAIIAGISRSNGIDLLEIYRHSITNVKFLTFLENLRAKYPFENIMIAMD